MAIWDLGFFDNDMACDWENDIKNNCNLTYIESALNPLLSCDDDSLDIDLSCKALAACESLARLRNNQGETSSYTKHLDDWVKEFNDEIPNDLINLAKNVIEKISSNDSELKQYWTLRGEKDQWLTKLNNLKERL